MSETKSSLQGVIPKAMRPKPGVGPESLALSRTTTKGKQTQNTEAKC